MTPAAKNRGEVTAAPGRQSPPACRHPNTARRRFLNWRGSFADKAYTFVSCIIVIHSTVRWRTLALDTLSM